MAHGSVAVYLPEGKDVYDMMHLYDGNVLETIEIESAPFSIVQRYNPNGQWDWYTSAEDERSRYFGLKPGDHTFAVILPEGAWIDRYSAGLQGYTSEDNDRWREITALIYEVYGSMPCVSVEMVDAHF